LVGAGRGEVHAVTQKTAEIRLSSAGTMSAQKQIARQHLPGDLNFDGQKPRSASDVRSG
jgi:hypothetical protein